MYQWACVAYLPSQSNLQFRGSHRGLLRVLCHMWQTLNQVGQEEGHPGQSPDCPSPSPKRCSLRTTLCILAGCMRRGPSPQCHPAGTHRRRSLPSLSVWRGRKGLPLVHAGQEHAEVPSLCIWLMLSETSVHTPGWRTHRKQFLPSVSTRH